MINGTWEAATRQMAEQVRFQLGSGEVAGETGVLVRQGETVWRLSDLLPERVAQAAPLRSVCDLLDDWEGWIGAIDAALDADARDGAIAPDAVVWGAPVTPPKMVCIGTNYREHIDEMHRDEDEVVPKYPYSFMVPATTGVSPTGATVTLPAAPRKFDWEGEVGVLIGKTARHLQPERAMDVVAGYLVVNDLSVRDYGGPNAPAIGVDWVMAKAYDGFKPIGPYVTPSPFVADPQDLAVRTWVNGELKQDGNSRDMIFSVVQILVHLSAIMTLQPGDVIATGTPDGVGHGRRPPEYLSRGDHVAVEVAGLGRVETHLA